MADEIFYVGAHVTTYVDLWDAEDESDPPAPVVDPADVIMTAKKPGTAPDEIHTLEGGGVEPVAGIPGRFRARYLADGIDGDYYAVWDVESAEGLKGVDVIKTKVKPRPE
jgi:hypothetical protein